MKKRLFTLFLAASFGTFTNVYAYDRWKDSGCDDGACQQVSVCNDCECSDPNYARNPCISPSQYCEVFGNPGGLR